MRAPLSKLTVVAVEQGDGSAVLHLPPRQRGARVIKFERFEGDFRGAMVCS